MTRQQTQSIEERMAPPTINWTSRDLASIDFVLFSICTFSVFTIKAAYGTTRDGRRAKVEIANGPIMANKGVRSWLDSAAEDAGVELLGLLDNSKVFVCAEINGNQYMTAAP
jgi:hypothetical protein